MKHGRVDIAQRNTRKAPNESHKLVQILCTDRANECAKKHQQDAREVLLPFDLKVALAALVLEDAVLNDTRSGEELQGNGEQDRDGVNELNHLHELAVCGEIDEHDRLYIRAIGSICQCASAAEQH